MSVATTAARARETLARTTLLPGWLTLTLVLPLAALGLAAAVPPSLRYLPLVASALVLGIPHGAVDHLTPARARGSTPGLRQILAVSLLYLALGGAYAVAWVVAPAASFAFFLLLTWVHWGQGDLYHLVALFDRTHLDDRPGRALTAAVRGGLPMVVPLVGSPGRYHDVATGVVGLFDTGAVASLSWLLRTDVRLALGGGLATLSVVALARGYRRAGPRRAWRVDAAETVLLWAFFLLVPPVLAIGFYFPLWHSLRHVGRLIDLEEGGHDALVDGEATTALWRFARDALPLTLVSVVLLGVVAAAVPAGVGSLTDVAAAYLVLLAVLTLPHFVVVTYLDRRQGVW